MSNLRDTSQELRNTGLFSGSDLFMRNGHQIINSNRAFAGPRRKKAKWAYNDEAVQKLLLRVFPKLSMNRLQRERAGRWVRVIQLFYRSGMTRGAIAEEMKLGLNTVHQLLNHIRRAAAGYPCSGSKKRRKVKS